MPYVEAGRTLHCSLTYEVKSIVVGSTVKCLKLSQHLPYSHDNKSEVILLLE